MGAKLLSPSRGIFSEAQCRLRHRHRQRQRHSTRCGAMWLDSTRDSPLEIGIAIGAGIGIHSVVTPAQTKLYQTEANKENERLETAPTVAAPANLFGTAKLSLARLQVVTVWGRSSALGNLRVSREQKKKQLQNTCNFISLRLPAPNSRRI